MQVQAPDLAPFRIAFSSPRETVAAVAQRFGEHELFLRASAIAFQVLTAVVPFALFATGLAGAFGLEEVWEREVEPTLRRDVSVPAFVVIDDAVTRVLTDAHLFWATGGLGLAIWQLAGAVRASGATLDRLYGDGREPRPAREAIPLSLLLAAAVALCLVAALAVTVAGPLLYGDVGPVLGALLSALRYAIAGGFLLLAVGLVVHHAPAHPQRVGWVTVGAVLACAAWLLASAGVGAYVTAIASWGSVYGAFASVVVLLAWAYFSALAFVAGIATDAVLRDRAR